MSTPIDLALLRQGDQLLAAAYAMAGDNADALAIRQAQWTQNGIPQEDIMPDETPETLGRGRPRKAERSTQTMIRMAPDLLRRIEDYRQRTEAAMLGLHLTMADAIRMLLERALAAESLSTAIHRQQDAYDTQQYTENRQQAAHSTTPAPPVPDTPVPQADAVQPIDPAPPVSPAPGDELPQHIRAIAEARAQYDKLTLAELAQLLFDRGIYRTQAKDGTEVPVNRGTLQRWLDRAKQAGLL